MPQMKELWSNCLKDLDLFDQIFLLALFSARLDAASFYLNKNEQ